MEKHHKVQILDEALEAAVKLSHRYIPARQLPDKSVSLLDTACARVAVSLHATPAEVDDCRKRIEALVVELGIITRESGDRHRRGSEREVTVAEQLARHREVPPRRAETRAGRPSEDAGGRAAGRCAPSCAPAQPGRRHLAAPLEAAVANENRHARPWPANLPAF